MAACCSVCLQHKNVERAVMVEIDGEVIRLSKEFLPGIGGDAWNDPRAEVIVGDGIDYVKHAPDASFDVIIVDSTDPIGVGEVLFTDEFYARTRAHPDPARAGREPVRRAVHAGRRAARDQPAPQASSSRMSPPMSPRCRPMSAAS